MSEKKHLKVYERKGFVPAVIVAVFVTLIVALILGIGLAIIGGSSNEDQVSRPPVINVDGLTNDTILTSEYNYRLSFSVRKPNGSLIEQSAKLYINDSQIETNKDYMSSDPITYSASFLRLRENENKVRIILSEYRIGENPKEVAKKQFTINYKPVVKSPKPTTSVSPSPTQADDTLFEAEITCQEYAENQFGVNDINISYDQSSIKRKNADGTIIIKVNIADSKGLLQPQKPLGIMECTTDSTGMKVTNFLNY